MNILFTNKTNKNTIYLIIWNKHKIKDKNTLKFIDKFKFPTWTDFSLQNLHFVKSSWKVSKNILIFVRNVKKFEENLESIVVNLWNEISKADEKFSLSFKKMWVSAKTQEIFLELLMQKLYKYTDFLKKKPKFSLNIDADIQEQKFLSKMESVYFARDLMNMPVNKLNPQTYEEIIKAKFKNNKNVKIKVLQADELQKIGAEWIYSVWKWSKIPPRMIILEYKVQNDNKFDALVWKWVTFDSGWYNIKPTGHMEDMHMDMGWSAVALWTFKFLTENWYKKNLICAVGIVENMVSDRAYTPTDILKMYNGKTVQIANTDAEWRLVLADTLAYVQDKYKIKRIFDFATLTGAAIVALWNDIIAVMWNNPQTIKKINKISWEIKERAWELPLLENYKKKLKSNFADISNVGKWWWGTITAWLFLSEFVTVKDWTHFDIAWPSICSWHEIYGTGWSAVWTRLAIQFFEENA